MRPDNTFEISIDHTLVNHGSLLDSFTPPVNPPAEIDDPEDSMPKDWDERSVLLDLLKNYQRFVKSIFNQTFRCSTRIIFSVVVSLTCIGQGEDP